MESFWVLAGQGNNKQVCVTAHTLIPDFNLLIVIQIRFAEKRGIYYESILGVLIVTNMLGQSWRPCLIIYSFTKRMYMNA